MPRMSQSEAFKAIRDALAGGRMAYPALLESLRKSGNYEAVSFVRAAKAAGVMRTEVVLNDAGRVEHWAEAL